MMAALEAARDALAACASILTAQAATPPTGSCKVGLEPNISPASYPMIRVVPSRIVPGKPYAGRSIETLLYFGTQTATSVGMETVYENLSTLEGEMLAVLKTLGARYIETITDEDRLDAYKLMVIRCELPDPPAALERCQINAASLAQSLTSTPAALAPFTVLAQEAAPADWTPTLASGSISRLLNGAASTTTRVTAAGSVAGPDGAAVLVALHAGGVQIGNAVQVLTTGAGEPVAFEVSAVAVASGTVAIDLRAAADQDEDFAFADLRITAAA